MLRCTPKDPAHRPRVFTSTTRWPGFCPSAILQLAGGAHKALVGLWGSGPHPRWSLESGAKLLAGADTFIENPKPFGHATAD
jgi:hypothetical protein